MAKMNLEERHSHSMSSMSMSMPMSMSMSSPEVPSHFYMQEVYWVFVFIAVAIAAAVNGFNLMLLRQRMAAYNKGDRTPSKPKNFIFYAQASITAIVREIGYCSWRPISFRKTSIYFPPFGPCILIGANLLLIISCWFYAYDVENPTLWEEIGYRLYSFPCL